MSLFGWVLFDLLNGDFYYYLFHQVGLAGEYFRLMDIGWEKNDELSGWEGDIAKVLLCDGIESEIFFRVIRRRSGLVGQGRIAEFFCSGDHDLDIGIFTMTFGGAFCHGFGHVFVYDDKGVVPVNLVFAGGHGVEVGFQDIMDRFFEIWADDLIPVQLGQCRGDHVLRFFGPGR